MSRGRTARWSAAHALAPALLGLAALAAGCGDLIPEYPVLIPDIPDTNIGAMDISGPPGASAIPAGARFGDPCSAETPCRAGLLCQEDVCVAEGGATLGGPCTSPLECELGQLCTPAGVCAPVCQVSAECDENLYCSLYGYCAPAGDGGEGTNCATSGDCIAGLVCEIVGFSGTCVTAGDGDMGATCETVSDCAAGLICDSDGKCSDGNVLFAPDLYFEGVECQNDSANGGPFRVLFELPREGAGPEFYRLPFPNDIRMADGHPNVQGHPTPGPGPVGTDIVARFVDALGQDSDGWSTTPTMYFRFSAPMSIGSISNRETDTSPQNVYLLNLDPTSGDRYGKRISVAWSAVAGSGSAGKYICQNRLMMRPPWERPLQPGRTYAAIVESSVTDSDGAAAEQDSDFRALLVEEEPDGSDPVALAAWTAYQPLRDYVRFFEIDPSTIAAAAVFTTQNNHTPAARLREAVWAQDAPTVSSLTLCDEGAVSPCDDELSGDEHVRGCMQPSGTFWELHGKVRLPIFQQGEAPYELPSKGGGVAVDETGLPVVERWEDVCFSATIPKTEAPATGWPVALYAHGTGGTFRSQVSTGVAESLSAIDLGDGSEPVRMAVVGFDGVAHGARRAGSDLSPEELFFNAFNPTASRGNVLQGAADLHAMVRALREFELTAADSPTGEAIRFDLAQLAFIGHSQGGTVGAPFLAYEPDVRGAVLSGTGGGVALSVLGKSSPQDARAGLEAGIQETGADDKHPVVNLLQTYFDPVDPLNYAESYFYSVPDGQPGKHVLITYGLGDTYTPPDTIEAFASATRATLALPELDGISGVRTADPADADPDTPGAQPLTSTWWTDGQPITAAIVEGESPQGFDGHFVMFHNDAVHAQFRHFVGTLVRDGLPVVLPQ